MADTPRKYYLHQSMMTRGSFPEELNLFMKIFDINP
jgi:hypothetical protein